MHSSKTPAEWYANAEHAYTQQHQGCAWCGHSHSVRHLQLGSKQTFSCQRCDFQASFDAAANRHHMVRGENLAAVSETMFEQPIANLM